MSSVVQSHFDRVASSYQARSSSFTWAWLRNREFLAVLNGLEEIHQNSSILELGCGAGYYLRRLRFLGFSDLTGVDLSQEMIAHLSREGIAGHVSPMESFSCDRRYDIILCAGALEFSTSAEDAIQNVAKLLKQEGRFVLLYPAASIFSLPYSLFHLFHGIRIRKFTVSELIAIGARFGLEPVQQTAGFSFSELLIFRKCSQ